MQIKLFEIRDSKTMIPVMAIKPFLMTNAEDDHERAKKELFLWKHAGYSMRPDDHILLIIKIATQECSYSAHNWSRGARTMLEAHLYIQKNWQSLKSGDLIDVEYILGETKQPKTSEMYETL